MSNSITLPLDTPDAILEALTLVNDYGLAGYGVTSARPGPDAGTVSVELAEQPETILAQVRVRIRESQVQDGAGYGEGGALA